VAADGTFTDAGTVSPTHWALQTSGAQLLLNDLTGGQPKQTLIGLPNSSGVYSNANGSIAGNGPHNPFLFGPITFTLTVPGVTAASTITEVTFSFGTTVGQDVAGIVPEPASATLIAVGLTAVAALAGLRRRSRPHVMS
jgi:MYXO-CTERM domain-containing protein